MKVYIVAECCGNHMGSMNWAKLMIEKAKDAGANAVKTQYFKTDQLFKKSHKLYDKVKEAELSIHEILDLKKHANNLKIDFVCTVFKDPELVKDLEKIELERYKIREADSQNRELIDRVLQTGKPVFISTQKIPLELTYMYHPRITWMYCCPRYPPLDEDIDLNYVTAFHGFSDHTTGITAPIGAAAIALSKAIEPFVIEKHVTLDHEIDNLDKAVSVDFKELEDLVNHIRRLEKFQYSQVRLF